MSGSMELNAALWSFLPFNCVDRVLSYLPVPDLCRYCLVCKGWNRLISTREFGALCAQNAAERDPSFIVIRYRRVHDSPQRSSVRSPEPSGESPAGCCFLDLNTRRWHTVEDDDIKYRHELHHFYTGMDGGLVCQYSLKKRREGLAIVVYNPIGKTLKELPTAPCHSSSTEFPELHMIVDSSSQSFKIFLINHNFNNVEFLACPGISQEDRSKLLNDPLVRVYDSITNKWKSLTNPYSCVARGILDVCCVMFRGYLYFLLGCTFTAGTYPLWRYNLSEDVWENVPMNMPGRCIIPQLIVSDNRLYVVAWWLERVMFQLNGMSRRCRFEVSEIKISDMVQKTLFCMANEEVMEAFDIKNERVQCDLCPIIASGFGRNSILFIAKSSRKLMVYDLERRSWSQLPQIPLGRITDEDYFEAGKPMNLMLPNASW
ncbi:hypothetical protein KC19_7G082600 [Ceratodon purpureus]|uniref:F-box domain-containing protein n=2 Tax=Ceratodon purpureus TaxID=3225 RepID=A0A8T0H630_CERPU|nr:hypothetical protein KC19_7G082600 [Ceratodon purpureus]